MSTDRDNALNLLLATHGTLGQAAVIARRSADELGAKVTAAEQALIHLESAATALKTAPDAQLAPAIEQAMTLTTGIMKNIETLLPAGTPVSSLGSPLDEWKECRNTIDRCDKLLVDIRKTGFGFITAVVGAATFVFSVTTHFANLAKSWLLCMLVVLIIMLYAIDLAHQTWLNQAVERAKTLERGPLQFQLTQNIAREFAASQSIGLGVALYVLLLASACIIFQVSIPLSQESALSAARVNIYSALATGLFAIGGGTLIAVKRWWMFWGFVALFALTCFLIVRSV
ncbi:hypothetical protein JQ596_33595 [Bradyrhizobium manausense]|uniref:hypothetical protein n=1 Tax=Bradyrhizobium manausense TaxID=989370 RepID=UPI001BAAF656|nr:hypothetical protein [Bradyrhizobium manausense]MBR0830453.1 hypothetical protein [Bradyrhizobium manausense]